MPIIRIPVVHKFGIISHSQRVELQRRLLKQTYSHAIQNKDTHLLSKLLIYHLHIFKIVLYCLILKV